VALEVGPGPSVTPTHPKDGEELPKEKHQKMRSSPHFSGWWFGTHVL